MKRLALLTDRMMLRPFSVLDGPQLMEIAGRREIADTTISVPHPFTIKDAGAWIRKSRKSPATFAMARLEDPNRPIGYVGLRDVDHEHATAELSFWIAAEFGGRGLVTEAARRVIALGFEALDLNRICAFHMARNPASERVLTKLGMVNEGRLRQRVRKWGRFEDVLAWAIVREDWHGER